MVVVVVVWDIGQQCSRRTRWECQVTKRLVSARLMAAIACTTLTVSAALGLSACANEPAQITVAYAPFESTALVWIAEDQQFFSRSDLAVSFRKYDTGAAALEGMLSGEADIAVGTGEFPLVASVLQKKEPRVIASIARSELVSVIARKDRGIQAVADLKGKKIGTTVGTIAEFYLGRFLEINGLSMTDVTLVDLKSPADWVNAVVAGDVDAVATAEPSATAAQKGLGANAVAWSAQSGQPLYALAITTDQWLGMESGALHKFLEALVRAEEFAARNPERAQSIVQKRLEMDPASMQVVWGRNEFSLALDQSLIAALEDESRWLIARDVNGAISVPDFLKYISEDGLATVRPDAVNNIRPSSK